MHHFVGSAAMLLVASTAAGAQSSPRTVQVRGFTDFSYLDTQRPITEGFRLGQLAGHLSATLSEHVSFFTEATASGQSSGFSVEVERIFLRYEHNDRLKLSAGRFHAPTAYWNNAFHHGQWMQTTIGRPEMIRGGNLLVPIHFVGVQAEGSVHAGPLGLSYVAGAGNGRGTALTRAGDGGDANGSRAVVAGTTVRLPRLTGMQIGGTYYADRLTPSAAVDVRERILSAHFARLRETPEIIVEYARIRHDVRRSAQPVTQPVATSETYYGQLAYRLPGRAQAWKPYARYDHSRVAASDVILAPLRLNFDGLTGGVRYDFAPTTALKLEYRGERVEFARRLRTLAASLSFTFPGTSHTHVPEPTVAESPAAHD